MKRHLQPISLTLSLFSTFFFLLTLAGSAWAQADPPPLFGPETFTREPGGPATYSRAFSACNTGATYRLVVQNGAGGKDRVSSAEILLNGIEIFRSSDLNQKVERVEKEVSLLDENSLSVQLAGSPGGFLTVSLLCTSDCLDLAISTPTPGSTVNGAKALVQGTLFNAPGETGVVLASAGAHGEAQELAHVQGGLFAGLVPLQAEGNTLFATATDACGYQVRKEVDVYVDTTQETIHLSAMPPSGILEASGVFETELDASAFLSELITQYAWDFDGDGTEEQTGAGLSNVMTQYAQPGIYFPRITVTDAQGTSYEETAVVNVFKREEMDALLKATWEKMKAGLKSGDIERALTSFSNASKERYKKIFATLEDQFADIAAGMDEIQLIYLKDGRAKYRIRRQEATGATTYYIYFTRDEDGLWKIDKF